MKYPSILIQCILLIFVLIGTAAAAGGGRVALTSHNLSISGPGALKTTAETEVCKFCHTPHMAGGAQQPRWNRSSKTFYITYKSSTLQAAVGQPNGTSRLCLACHDGTVAMGMLQGKGKRFNFSTGNGKMPSGSANLGYDLSDDHPISFVYDNTLAGRNGQLAFPSSLRDRVKLDGESRLQCTSCHDSHSNLYDKFLVTDNRFSGLCVTCHTLDNWDQSVHRLSTATWNRVGSSPWTSATYTTVAENGCLNCHRPHNAGGRQWLLNDDIEENNCISCHNGNVAQENVKTDFDKPSRHPVDLSRGLHDPDEDPLWSPRHVECQDCHSSHGTVSFSASAPKASGALANLPGISSSGSVVNPLAFEYELCYRCHADNPGEKSPTVTRHVFEKNLRYKFNPANRSYHPIESMGKNMEVPSLLEPYTVTSLIYCTSCHSSDSRTSDDGGPKAPHGSIWEPILARQLVTDDLTAESSRAYALCYGCHSRNSILADESFPEHRRHIVDERAPCTACHDPHGVENTPHLINFDQTIVDANELGDIGFEDTGRLSGTCSLKCHNENHAMRSYPSEGLEAIPRRRTFQPLRGIR